LGSPPASCVANACYAWVLAGQTQICKSKKFTYAMVPVQILLASFRIHLTCKHAKEAIPMHSTGINNRQVQLLPGVSSFILHDKRLLRVGSCWPNTDMYKQDIHMHTGSSSSCPSKYRIHQTSKHAKEAIPMSNKGGPRNGQSSWAKSGQR